MVGGKVLKRIAFVLSLLLFVPAFILTGCGGDNKQTSRYNTDFKISASAQQDKISLNIKNIEKPKGYSSGDQLDVVMLKPYEYYKGEVDLGIFEGTEKADAGLMIGNYTVGNEATLKIDRYSGDYDQLYNKFVLAKDGSLVAGPFYVSQIDSERNFEQKTVTATKKGVIGDSDMILQDTGCGWTAYNIALSDVIYPNEKPGPNGEDILIDNSLRPADSIETFEFNGKTFYMDKNYINSLEDRFLECKKHDIKVVLICLNGNTTDYDNTPYYMGYKDTNSNARLRAFDTSTEKGMEYFAAVMEFLGERYSREDGKYGWVHRYVIGNEVDLSAEWNPTFDYGKHDELQVNNYVEEYLRALRIADQALKKYYHDSMVLVSLAHYWNSHGNENGSYAPYDLLNTLNEKTSYSGNFNWGLAGHNYPIDLGETVFLEKESRDPSITGDFKTTQVITWTNLEVYDQYLSQEALKFNGQLRRLYLTEGGVASGALQTEYTLAAQAAGIAYAYYKTVSLDCVDAFIYYRGVDNLGDGSALTFGLYTTGYPDQNAIKPSYEVFKYLDTQYSFVVANQYLDKIVFYKDKVRYSKARGNVTSYFDAMNICESNFDWEVKWKESNIITRHVDPIPEYEALI